MRLKIRGSHLIFVNLLAKISALPDEGKTSKLQQYFKKGSTTDAKKT